MSPRNKEFHHWFFETFNNKGKIRVEFPDLSNYGSLDLRLTEFLTLTIKKSKFSKIIIMPLLNNKKIKNKIRMKNEIYIYNFKTNKKKMRKKTNHLIFYFS